MGHQRTHHVAGVDPIGLGALRAAIDQQTGGIDDDHLDPERGEAALQPEPFVAGFVTAQHARSGSLLRDYP